MFIRKGGMKISVRKEKLVKFAHVMMHPLRYQIVRKLKGAKKPLYIAQIAKDLGVNRKLISFHLSTLLQNGLVEGEYRLSRELASGKSGKPVVVNYYKLTKKAERIISLFNL